MTQSEFNHLLHFCKVNHLPRPKRYPITGKPGQYLIRFNSNRFRGEFTSFTGAMAMLVGMLDEKKSSGWDL